MYDIETAILHNTGPYVWPLVLPDSFLLDFGNIIFSLNVGPHLGLF
ncbi:hypothetical protein ACP4OV_014343 [Aristida adscensionis]